MGRVCGDWRSLRGGRGSEGTGVCGQEESERRG